MKLFTFSADLIFDHDLKFAKMLLTIRVDYPLHHYEPRFTDYTVYLFSEVVHLFYIVTKNYWTLLNGELIIEFTFI